MRFIGNKENLIETIYQIMQSKNKPIFKNYIFTIKIKSTNENLRHIYC